MKKIFDEDEELYEPEEDMDDDMDDDVEDISFDIFEDEDEELNNISSYWNDIDESSGYGRKKRVSRYDYNNDY